MEKVKDDTGLAGCRGSEMWHGGRYMCVACRVDVCPFVVTECKTFR